MIKDFFRDLKCTIYNHIKFHEQLKHWHPYDYEYQIKMFSFCLEQLVEAIRNGDEEEQSRDKKVSKIKELINLLEFDFSNLEDKLYEEIIISKYEDPSNVDEDTFNNFCITLQKEKTKIYNKIFRIIKGQDYKQRSLNFDGTGIEGWWT